MGLPLIELGLRGHHWRGVTLGYGYRSDMFEHLGSREQDGKERDTGLQNIDRSVTMNTSIWMDMGSPS